MLRRQRLFALLFGPSVLLMYLLERLGVASDVAIGLMFLPASAIFVWNRAQTEDRLQGLAGPYLALCLSISLVGLTQYKQGSLVEVMHFAGLAGMLLSLGWAFWFMLFPRGPANGLIDK